MTFKPPPDPEGMFAGAYLNELRFWLGAYDVLTWNPETFDWVKIPSLQPVQRSLRDWNLEQAVFTAP